MVVGESGDDLGVIEVDRPQCARPEDQGDAQNREEFQFCDARRGGQLRILDGVRGAQGFPLLDDFAGDRVADLKLGVFDRARCDIPSRPELFPLTVEENQKSPSRARKFNGTVDNQIQDPLGVALGVQGITDIAQPLQRLDSVRESRQI